MYVLKNSITIMFTNGVNRNSYNNLFTTTDKNSVNVLKNLLEWITNNYLRKCRLASSSIVISKRTFDCLRAPHLLSIKYNAKKLSS